MPSHQPRIEPRLSPATFSFAGFTFEQDSTPDVYVPLPVGEVPNGDGAIITALPTTRTGTVAFPDPPTTDFDGSLTLGSALIGPASTTSRALNLPAGNDGTVDRSGFQASWSGGFTLTNMPGDDLVIYESASNNSSPEPVMIQVRNVTTGTWTGWYYEPAVSFGNYGASAAGAFAHVFDLTDMGVDEGQQIDAMRVVNMRDVDRMVDPGTQVSPGVFVASGLVIPEDNGATSNSFPDPGPLSASTTFGGGELDADPIYIGIFNALTPPSADVEVTKTTDVDMVIAGEPVSYTITVTNQGVIDVTGVTFTDVFPTELMDVSYTSSATGTVTGNTAAGTGNINDTLDLGAGASVTYMVTATLDPSATGTLINTATASVPADDPNPDNNTATVSDPIVVSGDLAITKDNGVTQVTAGEEVTYTIVVSNSGPSVILGAPVMDTFPADLTNVNWTTTTAGGGTVMDAAGMGDINTTVDLPPGAMVTFTVTAIVDPSATGTLVNMANVAAPTGTVDPNPENNSATDADPIVVMIDLSVTKTNGVMEVIAGTTTTYTVVVRNDGPSTAMGVPVIDSFPPELINVTWTTETTGGSSVADASGMGDIDTTVDLPSGASVTFTVVGTVDPAAVGTLSNTAMAVTPNGAIEADPDTNMATDADPIVAVGGLSVTKTNGTDSVRIGDTVVYTVMVRNQGPSTAMGVGVFDAAPGELINVTWTSSTSGGATVADASGTGDIDTMVTLLPGSSVSFTITGVVRGSPSTILSNTVSITPPDDFTNTTPESSLTATDADPIRGSQGIYAIGGQTGSSPLVKVFNADGSLRFQFLAYDPAFLGGVRVATGDVNGDGVEDIITGAGPGGGPHVRIFSGINGELINEYFVYSSNFTGGVFVAAGDVTGNGRAEVITGAGFGGGPHVRIFEAMSGLALSDFFAYAPNFQGGVRVAAGDVDGDGRVEVITGAGPGGGPHVRAFDGQTGAEKFGFFAYALAFTGGVFVAAGDVNGDGQAEIITGAGPGGGPHVRIFSGSTPMASFFSYQPGFTGGVTVGTNDATGEGEDVLLVAPSLASGVAVPQPPVTTDPDIFAIQDMDFLGGIFVG